MVFSRTHRSLAAHPPAVRRLVVLVGLLVTMLPVAMPTSANGQPQRRSPADEPPHYLASQVVRSGPRATATIRFATLNSEAKLGVRRALSDIRGLADSGATVIALQEMASPAKRAAVRERLVDCSMCPFDAYMPSAPVPGSTPILYRWSQFRLVDSGTVQVTEDTYVGPGGAGPSTLRAKYVNYVGLRERATGRLIYVLNNHFVPTVQAKDGGPNYKHPARLKLYRKHMRGLKALIDDFRSRGATVFVTGDFNVNYRKDRIVQADMFPYVALGSIDVHSSYQILGEPRLGTHILPSGFDRRVIDYVFASTTIGIEPVSQRVLTGYNSDHRPVIVDYLFES